MLGCAVHHMHTILNLHPSATSENNRQFYLCQACYDSAADNEEDGGLSGGCRSESLDCLNDKDWMYTVGCAPDDDTCYVLHCSQGSVQPRNAEIH